MKKQKRKNKTFGVGSLAYIPSQTRLIRYDAEGVISIHENLVEPVIVPIIDMGADELALSSSMVKVHYKGGPWWASGQDLYEVKEDSLGDSLE